VRVEARLASFPRARAISFNVSNVAGAEDNSADTADETFESTYDLDTAFCG
jgi:hypothetical protein